MHKLLSSDKYQIKFSKAMNRVQRVGPQQAEEGKQANRILGMLYLFDASHGW